MSYGKMPPQAYTKETLQEAFEWWSEQPEELRSQIQDKDDLVGYFLRINRGGVDSPKQEGFTKSAKESFSSELKGLVKNLDAFEGYEPKGTSRPSAPAPTPASVPMSSSAPTAAPVSVPRRVEAHMQQPVVTGQVFEPSIQLQFPEMSKPLVPTTVEEAVAAAASAGAMVSTKQPQQSQTQFFRLDETSQATLSHAKALLNLSSDEEALRALIALGGAKIRGLV